MTSSSARDSTLPCVQCGVTTVDERETALVEFVRTDRPLTWAYLTRPIGDDS